MDEAIRNTLCDAFGPTFLTNCRMSYTRIHHMQEVHELPSHRSVDLQIYQSKYWVGKYFSTFHHSVIGFRQWLSLSTEKVKRFSPKINNSIDLSVSLCVSNLWDQFSSESRRLKKTGSICFYLRKIWNYSFASMLLLHHKHEDNCKKMRLHLLGELYKRSQT